jgi:hypothetical protein
MMDKHVADFKIELEQTNYAKATAAALSEVEDTVSRFPDDSNIEEQSTEWSHLEALKRTFDAFGVHEHCGDITIDTETAPCVVNNPVWWFAQCVAETPTRCLRH